MDYTEYRIVKETQRNGVVSYYIQKAFMLYFWSYLRISVGMSNSTRIRFETLEEAQQGIQNVVNEKYRQSQKKITKREKIYSYIQNK